MVGSSALYPNSLATALNSGLIEVGFRRHRTISKNVATLETVSMLTQGRRYEDRYSCQTWSQR